MSAQRLPPLIESMTRPEFYPHRPTDVELRQTHISYVFLAGDLVYKVKKPVRFTFLDYSTLKKRYRFCCEEVRLNRRLAPEVYLGVVPIIEQKGEFFLKTGDRARHNGRVVEYAVKMRRLPETQMLDALIRDGRVGKRAVRALAKKLFHFHMAAAADRSSGCGTPEAVWERLADNFKETERFVGQTISREDYDRIREYSRGFIDSHRELLRARVREDKVREGHGDLRAEHVCLTGDITVFDCIEFDKRLRTCDVASEIAFLAMDLDFLGAPRLSEELVAFYASMARDQELATLLPFYKCYRAYVRGKVESLKSQEEEVPDADRDRARLQAERYFRLARRYALGTRAPALLIVCGLTGTGKSTVARMLGERTGFEVFNSDTVRKGLARIPPTARAAQPYRSGLYSERFTRLTYDALLASARRALEAGNGVIVDATFRDPKHRRRFLDLAADREAPVLFVECRARDEEVFRRFQQRGPRTDETSDATWEVYLRQREEFVPLNETIPRACHLVADTEDPLEDVLRRVEEFQTEARGCPALRSCDKERRGLSPKGGSPLYGPR